MAVLLLVDDNDLVRSSLSRLLRNMGPYDIEQAQDGDDALRKLKSVKPFVILTDYYMPNMDGGKFVRAVRSDPELKDTPIIGVAATIGAERALIAAGVDVFFDKPFDVGELRHCISLSEKGREALIGEAKELRLAGCKTREPRMP